LRRENIFSRMTSLNCPNVRGQTNRKGSFEGNIYVHVAIG
jgi:hypothetical protein